MELPAHDLLQAYFDRWQIEVNHRDEKQQIGIADPQVWNDESVDRQPAFLVAGYSFLLLAALEAHGPCRTDQPECPNARPRVGAYANPGL